MASVLETFYLLFQSNSKEIKQGTDDAARASDNLEKHIEQTGGTAEAMSESLIEKFTELAAVVAAAFSVERVGEFINKTAELNAELGLTAKRLGIDVEDLYAWGQAAEETGGSAQGLYQTLDFLNRGMADIATKGTSRLKSFFDELKIKVTDAPKHVRPLVDILGDLADRFTKMDAQGRAGIGEKLGLDPGIVLMLAQGRRGVEDLVNRQKELGTVTEADTEIAHKYERSLEELRDRMRLVGTSISADVLPRLTGFFDGVGKIVTYLGQHKGLVEGFFIGVAGVIAAVYLPAAIEAAAATWAFLAPILAIVVPIAAVGAAIAFLVDDVQNFLAGNKSVTGELSKTWPEVGEVVRTTVQILGEAFNWFFDLFVNGWKLAFSIVSLVASSIVAAVAGISGALHSFIGWFASTFPSLTEGLKLVGGAIEWIVGLLGKAIALFASFGASAVKALPKALSNASKSLDRETQVVQGKRTQASVDAEERHALEARLAPQQPRQLAILKPAAAQHPAQGPWLNQLPKSLAEGIQKAQVSVHTADASPLSAAHSITTKNEGDRTYNFKVDNITIQTKADDPEGISREVSGHLEKHWRQAINQFDDGVKG